MKKYYKAEIEIIELSVNDVVRTSGNDDQFNGENIDN